MNASDWARAAADIIRVLAGNPAGRVELYVTLAAGWLALVLVLSAAGKALGLAQSGRALSAIAATLGMGLVIVGMVAARLYLPQWNQVGFRLWILVASGVLVSLIVVVPLIAWLQKGGYVGALFAWILAILAAGLVIVLVGAIFESIAAGSRSAERGKLHRQQVERALE